MFKKFIFGIYLSVISTGVIAANTGSPIIDNAQQPTISKELNNPTVGSRQAGSEQLFGSPKDSGAPKPIQPPKNKGNNEPNNPTVGGRQAGSEQIFGQSATPSDTPQVYTDPGISKGPPNNPNVGGRQAGSEQIFGQSAALAPGTSNSK